MLRVAIGAGACWTWRNRSIDAFGTPVACGVISSLELDVCDFGRPDWHKFCEHVLVRAPLTSAELLAGESRSV